MESLQLLTRENLSERTHIPLASIDSWRKRGGGPAWVKVGRHVRYRPEDVAAWLADRVQTANDRRG